MNYLAKQGDPHQVLKSRLNLEIYSLENNFGAKLCEWESFENERKLMLGERANEKKNAFATS